MCHHTDFRGEILVYAVLTEEGKRMSKKPPAEQISMFDDLPEIPIPAL